MNLECYVDGYSVSIKSENEVWPKWSTHDNFQQEIFDLLIELEKKERRTVDCPPFNPKEGF